ncbi:MAG: hypothetical protein HYT66_00340 [Candidatus Yanofskybacteria bacterium]|nr:hypothetical protein [Candidatus Yanofskybacteria bacterium]
MNSFDYPLKHIRLQQLYEAGFNIADFVSFPPGKLDLKIVKKLFEKHRKISLRHFHSDENKKFACPFFSDQNNWDTIQRLALEHNREYYALYNETIEPKDAEFTGNIVLKDDRNYFVEYFKGPGTPRDIEHKTDTDGLRRFHREIGVPMDPSAPEALKRLASYFRNFLSTTRPILIEFQIYPYPIGLRQTQDIAWEWRKWT